MRRLTIEVPEKDLGRMDKHSALLSTLELLEILHIVRQDSTGFAGVCKVKFREGSRNQGRRSFLKSFDAQLLDQARDGACIYFMKSRFHRGSASSMFGAVGGYLVQPFEFRDGKFMITFVGSSKQVKQFLRLADKIRLPHRVVSLTEAKFNPTSPLSRMTEKQRKALITAFNEGYYDLPKRISARDVAKKLNVKSSTFVIHRIKAERRLIQEAVLKT